MIIRTVTQSRRQLCGAGRASKQLPRVETACTASWPPSEAFQTALRMSRLKSLAPSGGEEARPTGDHPTRHAETEAAVRYGPRYKGAAATGHSMYGVIGRRPKPPNGYTNEPPEESRAVGRRRSQAHR